MTDKQIVEAMARLDGKSIIDTSSCVYCDHYLQGNFCRLGSDTNRAYCCYHVTVEQINETDR